MEKLVVKPDDFANLIKTYNATLHPDSLDKTKNVYLSMDGKYELYYHCSQALKEAWEKEFNKTFVVSLGQTLDPINYGTN